MSARAVLMADVGYRIARRDDGGFVVHIARSGALPTRAEGFATEEEAKGWIAQDERLRRAAEPFSGPLRRKWRS